MEVQVLDKDSFLGIDLALFSAGATVSKRFSPVAAAAGAVVVDNSSAFRMDDGVPLVVPEVNPRNAFDHDGIIANPNCSTIQMVVVLKPLHERSPCARCGLHYQAVSGDRQDRGELRCRPGSCGRSPLLPSTPTPSPSTAMPT